MIDRFAAGRSIDGIYRCRSHSVWRVCEGCTNLAYQDRVGTDGMRELWEKQYSVEGIAPPRLPESGYLGQARLPPQLALRRRSRRSDRRIPALKEARSREGIWRLLSTSRFLWQFPGVLVSHRETLVRVKGRRAGRVAWVRLCRRENRLVRGATFISIGVVSRDR